MIIRHPERCINTLESPDIQKLSSLSGFVGWLWGSTNQRPSIVDSEPKTCEFGFSKLKCSIFSTKKKMDCKPESFFKMYPAMF